MTARDRLVVAGMAVACAAFAFCVIASVAYHWHQAVTKPGIAVSVVAMAACAAAIRLPGGDDSAGEQEPCPYDSCHHNHPELPERGQR